MLLAILNADMKEEPMLACITYLLNQLEAISDSVGLPGLSWKGSTTSSAFKLTLWPSIEIYKYPVLPHSHLLVPQSMQFCPP